MSAARPPAEVISIAAERAARQRANDPDATPRPRCAAITVAGTPCRNYAVADGRCRVHALVPPADRQEPAVDDAAAARDADDREEPRHADGPRRADDRESARRAAEREAARRGWQPPTDALALLGRFLGAGWSHQLTDAAAFLRRRLTGDYEIDEFGFDEDLTTNVLMPLIRPLHRYWWRVGSYGAEHIPTSGGALVVANHAGTLPADALITRLDILEQTGRHARELAADLALRTPFAGPFARKTGATLASGPDADRLLDRGELVAVWPEGFKGVGKPWRDRYRLQRFGRGGFVATALRAQVPIIPTAIVGSEEIYPLLFDLRLLARVLGLPYFPVVPQMFALPVLGPLALLPLPSKWVIEYGEPIDTSPYGPDAADDPMAVFELTDAVRDTIQRMLHRNLMGRRSVFL
ncbi:lysophospholipid acyltransferase family protein [Egicoccus sp. AB-alg6-2]|uniref:lysophospholipid acyltransferase family protein n=1 Tax=Egicoccus sp. AB-alg6-2 TaxID=3242692 RepID=UPI00359E5943